MARVVIDTNVLLVSVSDRSDSYWLYKAFKEKQFELAYTTEILAEYEEQFSKHWSRQVAEVVMAAILDLPNSIATTVFYKLNLISVDKDDNKFVDCAFASNAMFLVTEDAHFKVLKKIDFPVINIITLKDFKEILFTENLT